MDTERNVLSMYSQGRVRGVWEMEGEGQLLGSCLEYLSERRCHILRLGRMKKEVLRGFPGGAVVEDLPANAGDTGSSPGLGRSHMPRSN